MANEWNVTNPIDHTTIGDVPGEIRKLKASVKTQLDREHETAVDGDATGSEHSLGAAVLYMGTSAPTNRPDGATALASNNIDKGRLWLDTNYTPPALKYWSGSAWVTMGILVVGASPTQCFLISTTNEDSAGGRESQIRAKGTQSGNEVTTLGMLEFSHSGASDDQKGKFAIILNDGDDSDTPSKKAIEFIDTGKVGVANSLSVLDEDDLVSDDDEVLATQQSIKAYIDTQLAFSANTIQDADSATLTLNVTYTATSDGFVTVHAIYTGSSNVDIIATVAGDVVQRTTLINNGNDGSLGFSVASGETFIITDSTGTPTTKVINWRSRGTLSKPTK